MSLSFVPVVVFILSVGYQRWRSQRSGGTSHIDVFTYNVALLDLLGIAAIALMFFGSTFQNSKVWTAGCSVFGFSSTGHTLFHVLTCIERYLAVVHPIFYLRLRGPAGASIRNVTIGCVWLVCFVVMATTLWIVALFASISFVLMSFTAAAFFFCSLSVLCALRRPGPGQAGGKRDSADQSKRRAFQTMILITGTLSLRFINGLITTLLMILFEPFGYVFCAVAWSSLLFLYPSTMVVPLLFLQRMEKLQICGHKVRFSIKLIAE